MARKSTSMAASMSEPGALADLRLYPARPLLAASLAVFREGKVLLAQRAKPPARGLFSLPGGLVETGESLEAAALRDALEEVGVTADIAGPAGHRQIIERDDEGRVRRHVVIFAFAGRWTGGLARTSAEAAAVLWAGEREIAALALTQGLADIVRTARQLVGAA